MSSAMPNDLLSDVIGHIYDCAIDPGRWRDTLSSIYPLLRCSNATLELVDIRTSRPLLHIDVGIPDDYARTMGDYATDVVTMWGGWEKLLALPLDDVAVLSRERSAEDLAGSRYLQEWGVPQGLFDLMAIGLVRDASGLGSIGMGRHISAGPVTEDDLANGRLLLPHLQRAMQIGRLLDLKAIEVGTLEATLNAVTAGVVLVGRDLRIIHANDAARSMLNARDPIGGERGFLTLRNRAAEDGLRRAVVQAGDDEALMGRRGQGIPVGAADGAPTILHVLPLKYGVLRSSVSLNAAAAIFIARSGRSMPPPEQALCALFDLTPAEARVFSHAARGLPIADIASVLGVNATTIKTHLLRIYRKTDTDGRVGLMQLSGTLTLPL